MSDSAPSGPAPLDTRQLAEWRGHYSRIVTDATLYSRGYVADATVIVALCDEVDRLRASLRWALGCAEDGVLGEVPVHACEFHTHPERGRCAFHESWANARALGVASTPEEGSRGEA